MPLVSKPRMVKAFARRHTSRFSRRRAGRRVYGGQAKRNPQVLKIYRQGELEAFRGFLVPALTLGNQALARNTRLSP